MRRQSAVFAIIGTVLVATLLTACSPVQSSTNDVGTKPGSEEQQSADPRFAALSDVATDTVPSGPAVGELITLDEIKGALGREDVFFAACS